MIKLIFVLTSCTLLFLYSLTLCHTILDNCSFLSGFFSKLGLKNYLESIFFYSMSVKSTLSTLCLSNLLYQLYVYQIYYAYSISITFTCLLMSIKSTLSTLCQSNLLFLLYVNHICYFYSMSIKSTIYY